MVSSFPAVWPAPALVSEAAEPLWVVAAPGAAWLPVRAMAWLVRPMAPAVRAAAQAGKAPPMESAALASASAWTGPQMGSAARGSESCLAATGLPKALAVTA